MPGGCREAGCSARAVAGSLCRPHWRAACVDLLADATPTPRTRGDCEVGPRPCRAMRCRHWLPSDVDSCALDVAARGGVTIEEVGALLGCTRERVRQSELSALDKARQLARRARLRLDHYLCEPPPGPTYDPPPTSIERGRGSFERCDR